MKKVLGTIGSASGTHPSSKSLYDETKIQLWTLWCVFKELFNPDHFILFFYTREILSFFNFLYFQRWRSSARNRRTWSPCATPSLPSSTRVPEACPEVSFGLYCVYGTLRIDPVFLATWLDVVLQCCGSGIRCLFWPLDLGLINQDPYPGCSSRILISESWSNIVWVKKNLSFDRYPDPGSFWPWILPVSATLVL